MASYKPVGAGTNYKDAGETRTSYRARRSDGAAHLAACYAAVAAAARTTYEISSGYC
jgi:hypothetical protein